MEDKQEPQAGGSQQQYENIVLAATSIINQSSDQIVQMMQQYESAEEALSEVTATIISNLDERSGGTLPDDLILPASEEILETLAELADSSGTFQINKKVLQKAANLLDLELGEIYGVEPGDMAEVADQFDDEEQATIAGMFQNG